MLNISYETPNPHIPLTKAVFYINCPNSLTVLVVGKSQTCRDEQGNRTPSHTPISWDKSDQIRTALEHWIVQIIGKHVAGTYFVNIQIYYLYQ